MAETLAPHTVLSKLEEKEQLHLSHSLSSLVTEKQQVQANLVSIDANMTAMEQQRQQSFKQGIRAMELVAMESMRQERISEKHLLSGKLSELAKSEKVLIRQMLASENKIKAYGHIQKRNDDLNARKLTRTEQQRLDDLMAHRRTRRG